MCLATCLERGYKSGLGVDHWTTVKIILRGIRKCFLVMKVIEFGVKGYIDANFNTYPDDSE